MELNLNSNRTIQFANVRDYDTFTFPLIIVKGYIFENEGITPDDWITANYLDTDGNIIKQIHSRLLDRKFSFLLDLKSGKNDFVFKYKTIEAKIVFHHVLSCSKFVVSPVYIICNGEKPRHDIEKIKDRIFVGCSLIQTLIAETLYQCGFERKTFALECGTKDSGCLIFYSKLNMNTAMNMTSEELWEYFGREIMTSEHGFQHRKFLSFFSCGSSEFSQHLAIGGGGLALCSAEYIDTWPESIDEINHRFVDETSSNFMHTNNINQNYGNTFSASLGAVCHELCHTFDLGHTVDGIMGRDFDRVGIIFSILQYDAVRQETGKLQNFNCIRSKNDSLIICEGTCCRKVNINYSVNNNKNLSRNLTRNLFPKKRDFNSENSTYREKININDIFPRILFWSNGCATLLAHHKWINQCFLKNKNNINYTNGENDVLLYDPVRSIITSKFGIVVVQLRNNNGYVLKSWEFSERRKKTLFLVPICESRKADSIVIEDFNGNLIKKDIKHFLNDTKR